MIDSRNSRRAFLSGLLAVGGSLAAAPLKTTLAANDPLVGVSRRSLFLHNPHTGERISATYWADGFYREDVLPLFDHFLRDWRADATVSIDPKLLDMLARLRLQLGSSEEVRVLSCYRTAATNAHLFRFQETTAENSLHLQGRALDFHLSGTKARVLRDIVRQQGVGGVGHHPDSESLHIDTGEPRRLG